MLTFRKEQLELFDRSAAKQFENDLVEHLSAMAPAHTAGIGESGLRSLIQLGLARAKKYGFTTQGPVRFYLEAMLILGSDFDTDPQFPWAAVILQDAAGPQLLRADRLFDRLMQFVEAAIGPEFAYEREAMTRVLAERVENLPASGRDLEDEVIRRLQALYPPRASHVGVPALQALFLRAKEEARRLGLPAAEGASLLAALMFAFGHGACEDPQFPWIATSLRENKGIEPRKRVERLLTKTQGYLAEGLAQMNPR